MNDIIITESIEDSFIYAQLSNSNDLKSRLVNAITKGTVLTGGDIEEQLVRLSSNHPTHLTSNVLTAFDQGLIEIIYVNKPITVNAVIPSALPFVIRKKNNMVVATIFINSYGSMNDGSSAINTPAYVLYSIMEAAYIARGYQIDPSKIIRNTTLERLVCEVYTMMVLRILTKEYALSVDKVLYDKVSYAISKFFITTVWKDLNGDAIVSSIANSSKSASFQDIMIVNDEYNAANISSFPDLIKFISKMKPRMADLTVKYFMEKYIQLYKAPALIGLDYLPYTLFNIICWYVGSFAISQTAVGDIMKQCKLIGKFYPELSKIFYS